MNRIGIGCLLFLCLAGLFFDLIKGRIPNRLIIMGLAAGLVYRIFEQGIVGIILFMGGAGIPLLFLWTLYYFRMFGAGDIKLFCVIGGFMGIRGICCCLMTSFIAGAFLSMILLIKRGNLWKRLYYFCSYVSGFYRDREWVPYRKAQDKDSQMHFTIPITIGILFYVGGFY